MITEELLEKIISINQINEIEHYEQIKDLQDKIEKASGKLTYILKSIKAKRVMSILGQRDSDIYIQCLAKSGTTLMQMILYQMTTSGSMNFNHIYEVSPWLGEFGEFSKGQIREFAEKPPDFGKRRIFKSHFAYSFFKDVKKGKFVYLIRDAFDQIYSFYHHTKNYYYPNLEFDAFVNRGMIEIWFKHNTEWIKNESDLDIIYINYEDIIINKSEVVEKLANFLNIELNDEIIERVLERSSFQFMKKHEQKFGEQPEVDVKIYDQFIRKGKTGDGAIHFTKEQITKHYELSKEYLGNHKITKRYFENETFMN